MNFREAKSKFIRRSLICSIIAILVCWFMKLVGFDLFQLDLNNKFFNDMDLFFSKYAILKNIYITILLNLQLYFMVRIVQKSNVKDTLLYLLMILPLTIGVRLLSLYVGGALSSIIDIVFLIVVCAKFKPSRLFISTGITILVMIYELISLSTRSLSIQAHSYGFVASQILSIDFYLLLYLSKEMEVNCMGNDGTWIFFGPTAWIYSVAGFITGIFKGHPIKNAKSWYSKGLLKEDVRKAEKASISLAKAK